MAKLNTVDTKGYYPKVKGKKRKMAELLVNPECNMTVTEMCEQVGVSRATFYNWQRESDFKGYVDFLIDSYTDSELASIWRSLIGKAKSGSVEAQKLYFELKDKYRQKLEINSDVVFISGADELKD